jgi:hypothetical protein
MTAGARHCVALLGVRRGAGRKVAGRDGRRGKINRCNSMTCVVIAFISISLQNTLFFYVSYRTAPYILRGALRVRVCPVKRGSTWDGVGRSPPLPTACVRFGSNRSGRNRAQICALFIGPLSAPSADTKRCAATKKSFCRSCLDRADSSGPGGRAPAAQTNGPGRRQLRQTDFLRQRGPAAVAKRCQSMAVRYAQTHVGRRRPLLARKCAFAPQSRGPDLTRTRTQN